MSRADFTSVSDRGSLSSCRATEVLEATAPSPVTKIIATPMTTKMKGIILQKQLWQIDLGSFSHPSVAIFSKLFDPCQVISQRVRMQHPMDFLTVSTSTPIFRTLFPRSGAASPRLKVSLFEHSLLYISHMYWCQGGYWDMACKVRDSKNDDCLIYLIGMSICQLRGGFISFVQYSLQALKRQFCQHV